MSKTGGFALALHAETDRVRAIQPRRGHSRSIQEISVTIISSWLAKCPACRGLRRITYEVAPDRAQWGTEIVGKVKAWAKALTGPTSLPEKFPQLMNPPGSETGPGQLVTWDKSTVCTVDAFDFKFQWTTNSSKHIPFDWTAQCELRVWNSVKRLLARSSNLTDNPDRVGCPISPALQVAAHHVAAVRTKESFFTGLAARY